jgi:YhcH/YjgK/YiaL family protein
VYETKPVIQARFEAHRRYIDIQTIWSGEELIYVSGLKGLKSLAPYDSEKDIEFFSFLGSAALLMKPGIAAVLFPSDAHAPSILSGKSGIVAKTVVKVRV